ncbi:MAG: hypothetical protein KDC99_19230, partial [Cyclobacteriaceae bacterium]|nr:hypothetical protein [Cyclobacteriaceae bacterium]
IIKGIAIQQGVLNSTSKENIIEYLTSLEDVDGYLLLLDSAHDQVITDESWLKSAQDLFTRLLATGKSVIWSHSDISGIVLSLPGLSLAMGESLSSRKFHIDSDPPGGGRQGTFYYVDKLFVRAKWTEAITALRGTGEYAQILCTKPCCEHVDFNNPQTRDIRDLSTHLLKNLSDKFELYSSSGGRRIARADLAEAQRIFGELRQGEFIVKEALRRDVKPGTQSFLDNWSNVLRG